MAVQGGRPNNRQVVPCLMVRDGRAALDFYQKAFGAKVLYQGTIPGMPGIFAQFKIGESYLQLTDMPGYDPKGPRSPEKLRGTSVVLEMYVDDVDKSVEKAVAQGAKIEKPVADQFYGDRTGTIIDPFGHKWTIAVHVEDVTPEEMKRRMEAMKK